MAIPVLIGVVHLGALPGSPRFGGDFSAVVASAARDALALAEAGFDGVIVENFGDAPFRPGSAGPVTVAAMTACALAVRDVAPGLQLGINVLRNDAEAALAIAVAAGATFVRINVHTGARVTDQGVIEGRAHDTLRLRQALGASHVALLCDVDVKHSAPLAKRPLGEEAMELCERGLADAILVTGSGTGKAALRGDLDEVLDALQGRAPVLVASGVSATDLSNVAGAHGAIVGSCLRKSGRAGDPIDPSLARHFAERFRADHEPGSMARLTVPTSPPFDF